jgi:hypothetical protein
MRPGAHPGVAPALGYEDRALMRALGLVTYLELRDAGVSHEPAAARACELHGHDFVGRACDRCGAARGFPTRHVHGVC